MHQLQKLITVFLERIIARSFIGLHTPVGYRADRRPVRGAIAKTKRDFCIQGYRVQHCQYKYHVRPFDMTDHSK